MVLFSLGRGVGNSGGILAFCRRRRLGPFARVAPDAPARMKALAALARGGFAQGIARRALAMDPAGAEDRLLTGRQS